ncbi:gastric triacylglycerol lipase [Aethina tumida]|uniref:gastric triacylglycerol lipase n=1 Tax=Aethina tumida TaxID=116153 RepID=UPI00096B4544|nr:gastric triacylglycerol lipase [Aethina tumida]
MLFHFRNIIFATLAVQFTSADSNNVCPTFDDYETIEINPKCSYNPDVSGNITEMVTHHGFNIESHTVTTWDGYILEIVRIPSSTNGTCDNSVPKQPMLFVNGIGRDARCWLLMGTRSPALYYASKCYDVWLANIRGSAYSKHQTYNPYSKEFWDFSFHEQATIDIPAIIDTIANVSGQPGKLIYVGHSMGTTISYIYASVNRTHCKNNVKAIISLAPIANLNKFEVPFMHFLALNSQIIKDTLFLVKIYWCQLQPILSLCTGFPLIDACDYFLQFFAGNSDPNNYPEVLPVLTANGSSPMSIKSLMHYAQICNRQGIFAWYDYGITQNLARYNSILPPLYEVGKIPVNVDLIWANDDKFSVKDDVAVLYNNLPNGLKSIAEVPANSSQSMNHVDFITNPNIEEIYNNMNTKLEKYKN